ncbi:MAG: hypothetical protein JW809_16010 [Pirellulales bacterium]|nr:hypothetical protein [Pirellulales bacterium]
MKSFCVAVFTLAVLASPCAAAPARTWTDCHGKTLSAKFVRVHEGKVVLLYGGQPLTLPFAKFSEEDQQYIRNLLAARGKAHLLPPENGGDSGDDADAQTDGAGGGVAAGASSPERTWTDVQGRTIQARFVRVEGENAVLLKRGREISVPLARLSVEDQMFVAQQHEAPQATGRLPQPMGVPARPPGLGPMEPAQAPPVAPSTAMPGASFDAPGGPIGLSSGPHFAPPAPPPPPPPAPSFPEIPSPWSGGGNEPPPSAAPSFPGASSPAIPPQDLAPPMASLPSGPMFESVKVCENCKRQVPSDLKAGDRCPHCGTYFAFERDESGKVVKRAPGRWLRGGAVMGGLLGGAVAFVITLIRKLSRH